MDNNMIVNVDDAKIEIGKRLKFEIKSKRYSYRKIADATGISYSYLSDVANGKYLPSVEIIYKVSNFIGSNIRELLNGLEYWIKPKGVNFDSMYLTDSDLTVYYDLLEKEMANIERVNENEDELAKKNKSKIKLILKSVVAEDNSMNLLGILKGSTLTIEGTIKIIESGKIYFFEYNGKSFVRRIYDSGDYYILIPYSTIEKYKIQKAHKEDIKLLGLVSSVTTILI